MLIQLTFETIEETELASKIYSSTRKAHSNSRVSIDWCFLEGQIMRELLYIHAQVMGRPYMGASQYSNCSLTQPSNSVSVVTAWVPLLLLYHYMSSNNYWCHTLTLPSTDCLFAQ